ncbi:MAG: hypothetical protein K2Q10_13540, partial [Rhodospirillales bacterium]|nr:hypothetical protein [Rhodospirillales bacterium]
ADIPCLPRRLSSCPTGFLMTSMRPRTGGHLAWNGLAGEVIAYRDLDSRRQLLHIKSDDGLLRDVEIRLDAASDGDPASRAAARAAALAVLRGDGPRLPIMLELTVLAGAVVALTGEAPCPAA